MASRARCLGCGREWNAWPSQVSKGKGCSECGRPTPKRREPKRGGGLVREEWDKRAAAVGIEWRGDDPVRSGKKHAARCLASGHEWDASPASVAQGKGCPECRGLNLKRITPQQWHEKAAAVGVEWIGDPPANKRAKAAARCLDCGTEWNARAETISKGGKGCPKCHRAILAAGHVVPRKKWDERAAAAGIEWVGGGEILAAEKYPARCLTCGHQWSPRPFTIQSGSACPNCAGVVVTPDQWRERAAAVGCRWIGRPPPNRRTHTGIRCLACGHEWDVHPTSISQGHGCPSCAPSGYDSAAPALLYLLRYDVGPVMKVGVTSAERPRRLELHRRRGWDKLGVWPIPVGRDALKIEDAVEEWWRQNGAMPCKPEDVPEGDGYTEAVFVTAAAEEGATLDYIAGQVEQVGGGTSGH